MLSRGAKLVKRWYRGQLIAPVDNQQSNNQGGLLNLASTAEPMVIVDPSGGDVRDFINASVANLSPIGVGSSQSVGAVGDRVGGLRERVNVNANVNLLVDRFQLDLNRMIKTYGEANLNDLIELPFDTLVERIGELMIAFDITDSSLVGHLILQNPALLGKSNDVTEHIVTRWKNVNQTLRKFVNSINKEHTPDSKRWLQIDEGDGVRHLIRCAPNLLNVHSKGLHSRINYYQDEKRWPMVIGKRRQMLLAVYNEPSVLVDMDGDRRREMFDQYGFNPFKVNDIFLANPKVFTSLYADHDSSPDQPVSDLDARLFFLMKECDFAITEIVKYSLMLTMDFYILKGKCSVFVSRLICPHAKNAQFSSNGTINCSADI